MIPYYEDLSKLESAVENKRTLNIFDFDSTLFNSPVPNPKLWGGKMTGRIMGETHTGGYGWFQNPITLSDEYLHDADFNEEVLEQVRKSIKNPNHVTVMLTGRRKSFEKQIRKLISLTGIEFDEYGLKDSEATTMDFKQGWIKDVIKKHGPFERIEMWDDRERHVKKFKKFIDDLGLEGEVHLVNFGEYHLPEELEKDLVKKLENSPDFGKVSPKKENSKKEKKPNYYAAVLRGGSRHALLNQVGSEIDYDWEVIAHHMTLVFGKPTEEEMVYLKENMGKQVNLTAIALGKSPDAMAVKIDSDVPTRNKIPHITIAVPPNGKPVNSNNITNWKPLLTPIELKAQIIPQY